MNATSSVILSLNKKNDDKRDFFNGSAHTN